MVSIDAETVQAALARFIDHDVYIHLETTNGAYAAHLSEGMPAVGAFIRNGRIRFGRALITGDGPYRVGLKLDGGWVYAEGLTDFEVDQEGRLLLAGHDAAGRLAVALDLSLQPLEL